MDKKADFTPINRDLILIKPFPKEILASFPYIAQDFDSLTTYEKLAKIVDYLNKVIENNKNVSQETIDLYNAYIQLQEYVNTYFDDMEVINFELVKTDGLNKTYRVTFYNQETYDFIVKDGRAIERVERESIDLLTSRYTIYFNDNTTYSFNVTDGKSITDIRQIINGRERVITLTFNDGTAKNFSIMDAKSIIDISKIDTQGLVDTYKIRYNDNTFTTFSVTNGEKGDTGPQGPQGERGADGTMTFEELTDEQKESLKGPANNILIGNVTSGNTPDAFLRGESPNQILDLILPKGEKGEKGDTGPANSLSIGDVSSGEIPSASIRGTAPNQILDLVFPSSSGSSIQIEELFNGNSPDSITLSKPVNDYDVILIQFFIGGKYYTDTIFNNKSSFNTSLSKRCIQSTSTSSTTFIDYIIEISLNMKKIEVTRNGSVYSNGVFQTDGATHRFQKVYGIKF